MPIAIPDSEKSDIKINDLSLNLKVTFTKTLERVISNLSSTYVLLSEELSPEKEYQIELTDSAHEFFDTIAINGQLSSDKRVLVDLQTHINTINALLDHLFDAIDDGISKTLKKQFFDTLANHSKNLVLKITDYQ